MSIYKIKLLGKAVLGISGFGGIIRTKRSFKATEVGESEGISAELF